MGAGQGLLVSELRNRGLQCDGVDFSGEMVKHAQLRRGVTLFHADARSTPFPDGAYETVIYATGVIDFLSDEREIKMMLNEGRRILKPSGNIFVAFYRCSPAVEGFMTKLGLLRNNVLAHRDTLRMYLLDPAQMLRWVATKAEVGYLRAATLLLSMSILTTFREKLTTFRMQRIFGKMPNPNALINAAPEFQPYRNEAEIRNLFARLAIPIKGLESSSTCHIVEV